MREPGRRAPGGGVERDSANDDLRVCDEAPDVLKRVVIALGIGAEGAHGATERCRGQRRPDCGDPDAGEDYPPNHLDTPLMGGVYAHVQLQGYLTKCERAARASFAALSAATYVRRLPRRKVAEHLLELREAALDVPGVRKAPKVCADRLQADGVHSQ